jgi:molecular chaperone HtpG
MTKRKHDMETNKGQIGVTTENIFPVIKQFLYSDHEIFLRELVANAVDATQKLKALASNGEFKGELGDLKVTVELDEKAKVLRIIDNGIGMTAEEVDKYINQIAFSSAGEFLQKYKDQNIIGHFGLGFYSAFMVARKVTIESLSWQEGAEPVLWSCEGNPEFEMGPCTKEDRGTVITLFLDDDSAKDYGSKGKISQLLGKYCKFMPVPVIFGKEQEWKDGKYVDTDKDHVINGIEPLWTRKPSELKEEDYKKFYKDLYPMKEEPLFYIHLNVDYPFNLTGILYFPKIKERMAIEKNNIQLYCNQMFVTDHVDNIVPDFLTLLHGVIDSPDIPLNVSRSYLQADENVKKISTYITRKVADRLEEIFKNERDAWESKWDNLKLFIEYGMLSDEKFCERALKFALFKNTDGKFFSQEDYRKAIADTQTDKDGKVVYLYATDTDAQYSFIEAAKNKGYDVLLMDCELDSHYVNLLEQKIQDSRFARVDSDSVENLILKEEKVKPEMSDSDKEDLSKLFKAVLPKENEYQVEADNLGENAAPILITRNEFMRRYREMSSFGGGMNFYGEMPEAFDIKVNLENPVMAKIVSGLKENKEKIEEYAEGSELLKQVTDLALLANGMLKGKALADFIARSEKVVSDAYLK